MSSQKSRQRYTPECKNDAVDLVIKHGYSAAKPHGWILELSYKNISVGSHSGFVVASFEMKCPESVVTHTAFYFGAACFINRSTAGWAL